MRNTIMAALMMALASFSVGAETLAKNYYVGGAVNHSSIDYKNVSGFNAKTFLEDGIVGGEVYVGAYVHPRLSVEVGYMQTMQGNRSFNSGGLKGSSKVSMNGFTADALVNVPLNESGSFKALGSAGIARITAKAEGFASGGTLSAEDTDTTWRAGAGAEYDFTDCLSLRGMVRYMPVKLADATKDVVVSSVGLSYKF